MCRMREAHWHPNMSPFGCHTGCRLTRLEGSIMAGSTVGVTDFASCSFYVLNALFKSTCFFIRCVFNDNDITSNLFKLLLLAL